MTKVNVIEKQSSRQSPLQREKATHSCYLCGGKHVSAECCFKTAACQNCGKVGHIAKVCRSRRQTGNPRKPVQKQTTHQVQEDHTAWKETDESSEEYDLFKVTDRSRLPLLVTVILEGATTKMELDTGATMSLISQATYSKLWDKGSAPLLRPTTAQLRMYTGESLNVLGELETSVTVDNQMEQLKLLVVEGHGPS